MSAFIASVVAKVFSRQVVHPSACQEANAIYPCTVSRHMSGRFCLMHIPLTALGERKSVDTKILQDLIHLVGLFSTGGQAC